MSNTGDFNLTWPSGHQCKNGALPKSPCLFDEDVHHHIQVFANFTVVNPATMLNLQAWLVGSNAPLLPPTLKLDGIQQRLDLNFSKAAQRNGPDSICAHHDFQMTTKLCKDKNWYFLGATLSLDSGSQHNITIDFSGDGDASIVVETIANISDLPQTTTAPTTTTTTTTTTTSSSTQSTRAPALLSSSDSQQSFTSASPLPTSVANSTPQTTSQESSSSSRISQSAPTAAVHGGHSGTSVKEIAPAVIVSVALLLGSIAAYFIWRRRRRLARSAPSAIFKGESPDMKPWMPLSAQRSASRLA